MVLERPVRDQIYDRVCAGWKKYGNRFMSDLDYKTYNSGISIGTRPGNHTPNLMGTTEEPWYTRKSIEFLANYLTKDMHIFEYGAGSSTAWFALRVGSVISVEHEASWKEEVIDKLPKNITNVTIIVCPLGAAYVESIDQFADKKFDLICIDGRMRSQCILNSLNKVKPGGYLLVDNAERPHYQEATRAIPADWEKFEFDGGAANDLTALFKRPAK